MNEIIRYEVYDKKDRWMGGYSTELDKTKTTSALAMAKLNLAYHSNGRIVAIHSDGSTSRVKL